MHMRMCQNLIYLDRIGVIYWTQCALVGVICLIEKRMKLDGEFAFVECESIDGFVWIK